MTVFMAVPHAGGLLRAPGVLFCCAPARRNYIRNSCQHDLTLTLHKCILTCVGETGNLTRETGMNNTTTTVHCFEAADEKHVIPVFARMQPVGERRRMVQRPRCDTIELLEPSRRVLSVREDMPAFAEHAAIQIEQRAAESDVGLGVIEIAVRCAAQLVSGAGTYASARTARSARFTASRRPTTST